MAALLKQRYSGLFDFLIFFVVRGPLVGPVGPVGWRRCSSNVILGILIF
jgi:hypothetical protein